MYNFSSLIFNRLREDPTLCISYFFFNHSNRDELAENVLRELLRQVLAQLPTIPINVTTEYSRYKNDPHRIMPSQHTFTNLLKSSLEQFSSSLKFILIDAYDEFRNTDDEDSQRINLCSALSKISSDGSTRILMTTRPQCAQELKDSFPYSQIAFVKGDLADVEKYLDDKIRPLKRLNEKLKANIKETILESNRKELWYK
jgi:hypothetical protein